MLRDFRNDDNAMAKMMVLQIRTFNIELRFMFFFKGKQQQVNGNKKQSAGVFTQQIQTK